MNAQTFSLRPFASDAAFPKLSGRITRTEHRLILQYDLLDDRAQVFMPAQRLPQRQHDLWQTTCFEFFLGLQNSSQYWEFNLSPSGDWNVYRFSDYRTGMQEETAFTSLPFNIDLQEKQIALTIELDLTSIVQLDQPLDVAITAVLQILPDHNITYWALQHCGTEADFHLRESFAIAI